MQILDDQQHRLPRRSLKQQGEQRMKCLPFLLLRCLVQRCVTLTKWYR